MKTPFVTKDQLEAIAAQYPTPFHIYDERGIRENARRLRKAFAWNPGYREYFAVKAAPTPALLKLLHEEGCGCDCSSMTELMISERCGITGEDIMFSSNDTTAEEFQLADRLGVTPAAVGNYETGISFPREDVMLRLFDCLETDPNTLFQDSFQAGSQVLTQGERQLLEDYRGLSPLGRESVRAVLQALRSYQAELEESRPEEPQEEPQPEKKKRRFWPFGRKRDEE